MSLTPQDGVRMPTGWGFKVSLIVPYKPSGRKTKSDRIVLVNTGSKELWDVIGGSANQLEPFKECGVREGREEAGYADLVPVHLLCVTRYMNGRRLEVINPHLLTEPVRDMPRIVSPEEIHHVGVFGRREIEGLHHEGQLRYGRATFEAIEAYYNGGRYPLSLIKEFLPKSEQEE